MNDKTKSIPNSWRYEKLKNVAEVVNGYGFPERLQGKTNLPYPFIKVSDMNSEGAEIVVSHANNTVDDLLLKEIGGKVYPVGTVIFPKVGGALLTNKKRILGREATFDNNVMGIIPVQVISKWLYYWFLTIDLKSLSNVQALPSIKQSVVADLSIPVPPLEEQKRIAARLDEQMRHIEQARLAAEESLSAAWELPSAYFGEVFGSPDARKWKIISLGEILVSTKNGLYKHEKYYGRGKPILKMYNIGRLDGTWNLERVDQIELTEKEYEDYRLNTGDILINRVNSRELVGKCAVVDNQVDGAVYESKNIRIRLDTTKADSDFVAAYLNSKSGRDQFARQLKQIVGQATINRADLDGFKLPLPPLEIQKQIMKELLSKQASTRYLVASIESQLAEIESLPSAVLGQAFAGQL